MNLFKKTGATTSILAYDLFLLLGIKNMTDEQKEKYLGSVEKLILEYFLQEKVGRTLKPEQLQELMNKYPPTDEKNVEAMIQAIGEMLPNASDLFVDASLEVKARLVRDQYATIIKTYEKMLAESTSANIRNELTKKISASKKLLSLANEQRWAEIATENQANMSTNLNA